MTSRSDLPCQQYPDAWFPVDTIQGTHEYSEGAKRVKAFCQACPARVACLVLAQEIEAGLPAAQRYGIWGGLTPSERLRISKPRRVAA